MDWRSLRLSNDSLDMAQLGELTCSAGLGRDEPNSHEQDRDTIPNTFAEDSGATSADYASFFIFWLCSLPAIWFPVHKIRHLFTVKAYFVPCAGVAFFIWAIVRAGGIGPIVHQPSSLTGSALGWEIVKGKSTCLDVFSVI